LFFTAPTGAACLGHALAIKMTSADVQTNLDNIRLAAVPIPAAAWLFGYGLPGLVGMARRKKTV